MIRRNFRSYTASFSRARVWVIDGVRRHKTRRRGKRRLLSVGGNEPGSRYFWRLWLYRRFFFFFAEAEHRLNCLLKFKWLDEVKLLYAYVYRGKNATENRFLEKVIRDRMQFAKWWMKFRVSHLYWWRWYNIQVVTSEHNQPASRLTSKNILTRIHANRSKLF